jgi:hypothetical protein
MVFYRQYRNQIFFHSIVASLILTGCAEQLQMPTRICPGKETAIEALSILSSRSRKAVPLKANGQCRLEYYADGKLHKENFPVQVWLNPVRSFCQQGTDVVYDTSNGLNPPAEICMQGDVAFDPRGIVLGSNEDEFWLAIRLKEISSCWLGTWAEANSVEGLMINPRIILEALGIMAGDIDETRPEGWSLSKERIFDVLTRHKAGDKVEIIQKIYIYNCDYSVTKIEYFDINERPILIVELDKYEQVVEEFFTPRSIKIIKCGANLEDLVSITVNLTSVKSANFNAKQRGSLFNPPKERGFKHIFINIDGKWMEQRQD